MVGTDPLVEIKVLQKAVVASVGTGSALVPVFSATLVEAEVATNAGVVSAGMLAVEGTEVAAVAGPLEEREVVSGTAVEAVMVPVLVVDAGPGTDVPVVEEVAGTEPRVENMVL